MKRLLSSIFVISLVSVSAQAAPCERHFALNPHPLLKLADVRRLADRAAANGPGAPENRDGGRLIFWPFDEEDHPIYGKWRGIGLIFATRGDLGEPTVGGLLLQSRATPPVHADRVIASQKADGLYLSVQPRQANNGCPAFVVKLDNMGTLFADGKPIGRLP
jgi:hypothetical protein